ncbi:MAG: response regulator [Parvibaculum sp.]|nr:response regulator [Parvibaculum sp.]
MAKILVVEDNPDLGDLLLTFIAAAGHQVTLRASSLAALDTLQEQSFDLVITDMFMPDRDGLEILREAKRLYPDTPVLAMSGGSRLFPTFDPLACARQFGAFAILPKPFRRSELISMVEAALASATIAPPPMPSHSIMPRASMPQASIPQASIPLPLSVPLDTKPRQSA